ncbi:reverse transcriptase-like protein [Oceanobacillus sp. CAU 1775]
MQVRIELTYITKNGITTSFSSNEMQAGEALIIAEDIERTGRMKQLDFIDDQGVTWTTKELKKYMQEIKTEPHNIEVYFDGGFNPERNLAGLGFVIYYEQNQKKYRIRENALVEGILNNNEAEYAALHLALKALELLDVKNIPVIFVGDSKVVINQLSEEWAAYEKFLIKWMDRIEAKIDKLGIKPTYKEVSRKLNREADHLATQALQGIEISSQSELE